MVLDEEQEPEARWLLTTAKVVAFEKQAVGNAPPKARCCIVGSMLQMFVARVLRLSVRGALVSKYEVFNQFGAGTSGGVEFAYQSVVEHHRHRVKQFQDNPDPDPTGLMGLQPVLLKYDSMNAFPRAFIQRYRVRQCDGPMPASLPVLLDALWATCHDSSGARGGWYYASGKWAEGLSRGIRLRATSLYVRRQSLRRTSIERQFPNVWFSWSSTT